MQGEMRNPYKREDVFCCNQGGHERFENAVSVYHVLRERECYPEGCVWFQWRCRHPRGEKGCPRGFRHVGKMCLSCPHFYDEKVLRYPRLLLSPQKYREFLKELQSFEEWLRWLSNREIEAGGTVNSVKPHFKEVIHSHGSHVTFHGFLLNFAEVYLDLVHWKDFCYVTLGKKMQSLHRFRKGDQVSFRAKVRMDWGRLVLFRVRAVEMESKAEGEFWTESKAHLARRLGASCPDQPERCLGCERGALLDVVEGTERLERRDRRLFCLEGFSDPGLCSLHAGVELALQRSRIEKEAATSEGI